MKMTLKNKTTIKMKTALLAFAALSILSQIPHAFYVVKIGSNLKEGKIWGRSWLTPKNLQAAIFSIIIANAIMFTVLLGMHWVAAIWAVIEMGINRIYVKHSMEAKHLRRTKAQNGQKKPVERFEWIAANTMAVLIPFCIYAFSLMYAEYEAIINYFNN